jgi:hypothetical protein
MKFIKLLIVITVALSASYSTAELTGSIRNNFVQAFYKNCFSSQKAMAANQSVSDAAIGQYCRCSANYSADLYTNQMIEEIESGRRKIDNSIAELATKYCRANYKKY